MIRHHCDLCDQRTMSPEAAQPEFETFVAHDMGGEDVKIRLIRAIGGTWNKGTICRPCLATALEQIAADLRRGTP